MKVITGILLVDESELEPGDPIVMSPKDIAEHLNQLDVEDLEDTLKERVELVRIRREGA